MSRSLSSSALCSVPAATNKRPPTCWAFIARGFTAKSRNTTSGSRPSAKTKRPTKDFPTVPANPEDRRQSPRINATLDARLDFSVLMRDAEPSAGGVQHLRACAGHTVNISADGLGVVLHAQNID